MPKTSTQNLQKREIQIMQIGKAFEVHITNTVSREEMSHSS